MSHETVNGLRYAIEEAGAGEPLLLLHGFTGSRATWRDLWPQLATRFRVLAIDLPGHGGSDAPAGTSGILFNFNLKFTAAGSYKLDFLLFDEVNRTYYQDGSQATFQWTDITNTNSQNTVNVS